MTATPSPARTFCAPRVTIQSGARMPSCTRVCTSRRMLWAPLDFRALKQSRFGLRILFGVDIPEMNDAGELPPGAAESITECCFE